MTLENAVHHHPLVDSIEFIHGNLNKRLSECPLLMSHLLNQFNVQYKCTHIQDMRAMDLSEERRLGALFLCIRRVRLDIPPEMNTIVHEKKNCVSEDHSTGPRDTMILLSNVDLDHDPKDQKDETDQPLEPKDRRGHLADQKDKRETRDQRELKELIELIDVINPQEVNVRMTDARRNPAHMRSSQLDLVLLRPHLGSGLWQIV